ncbi:pyridoxine synthesis protein PDX2 [Durotheca rogersii]|uniref:pyridoxine synthesis protein PDX2 n=1 Tax=Durotheca rogersii TaxID=419775 RepID=UPI00221FE02A|nr:pyridoxine synthesis protein PDX2 [Durotheca rogersii]KAI5861561.1 pyridoxine synthesis protein PDX2 [Durotheca rogersii]
MATVGVLALQGGFAEHLSCLRKAAAHLSARPQPPSSPIHAPGHFDFIEVRTPGQLATCDGLVIPGGESTTLSLVAEQSGLLEPLRQFVKVDKKPTWGTCAGLIFLCEEASATKRGGQALIGGLYVKVHRNHFGRQKESFVTDLDLPFLSQGHEGGGVKAAPSPFPAVFIRAPVVDHILADDKNEDAEKSPKGKVEVLAILPGRHVSNQKAAGAAAPTASAQGSHTTPAEGAGDIVALRQGNVFGTSFHPELTDDIRIHVWWLEQMTMRPHP